MTYGVGMVLEGGLVLAADTRTNAGVDNVATFKKLHVWERKGERVIMLVTAGNLAVTQAVVALLSEEAQATAARTRVPIFSAHRTCFRQHGWSVRHCATSGRSMARR